MDDVKNFSTNQMFYDLSLKYGNVVEDIHTAKELLEELINMSNGLVIVDFLDTDNWDKIRYLEIDEDNELIYLYWFIPEKDAERMNTRKMVMPYDYCCAVIHFQDVEIVNVAKEKYVIILRGYTIDKTKLKVIEKNLNIDAERKIKFFSTSICGVKDGKSCLVDVLDTQIASLCLIPKDFNINTNASQKILYLHNLSECCVRLKKAYHSLKMIESSNMKKREKEDAIGSVGNKLRKIAENLFKLILCYYRDRWNLKDFNYEKLRLGDLINIIKTLYNNKEQKEDINRISILGNTLSHENGMPININEAYELYSLLLKYAKKFKKEIEAPRKLEMPTFSEKPSPENYIKNEICNWDFMDIVERYSTSKNAGSKILYFISYKPNSIDFFDIISNGRICLCKDGRFKNQDHVDIDEIFTLSERDKIKELEEDLYKKISEISEDNGYCGDKIFMYCLLRVDICKNGTPSHIFTKEEIKNLILHADDSKNNKLVIDEDGYARIIHNSNDACLYPVSHWSTWCARNGYVGENADLYDLDECYIKYLSYWLYYLEKGKMAPYELEITKDETTMIHEILKYTDI